MALPGANDNANALIGCGVIVAICLAGIFAGGVLLSGVLWALGELVEAIR